MSINTDLQLDLHQIFAAVPAMLLVIAPDPPRFTILAATDAYLAGTRRSEIVGRALFDVFPDNPDNPSRAAIFNTRASLERALKLHIRDTLQVQRYDISRPTIEGGGFEERHLCMVNTPVIGKNGDVVYLIHRIEEITGELQLKHEEETAQRKANIELTESRRAALNLMEDAVEARKEADQISENLRREIAGRQLAERARQIDHMERKKAENEMQIIFQRLNILVSNMHSSVLLVGENRVELVNQAFCDYFGIKDKPADLTGLASCELTEKTTNAYLHPEKEITRMREIIDRREPVIGEEIAMQGGRACLRDFIPIIIDGKLNSRLWHHFDITEYKKIEDALRRSEERHRLMAETMVQGVVHQDATGSIIEMNQAAERILGKNKAQFLGSSTVSEERTCIRENGENFPGPEHPSVLAMKTGQPVRNVIMGVYNPKLADYRWLSIDAVPLFIRDETHPAEVYTVFEDITERKQTEDDLIKQAAQLQEQAAQLEEANQELESFSYSISHDLKTPLRIIDGYSRMLMKKYGNSFVEDAGRMLSVIRDNAERMSALIDALLSFSRILRDTIAVAKIDMGKMASEVWQEILTMYPERELEIRIAKLLPAYGDGTLIRQVLLNLFSNAAKFTRDRKPGIIEMSSYPQDHRITYCVKDNGTGFDMAYYDKLFGIFQRLHSLDEYEGTGVGLAIVQRIIQRHGGHIWAEGKPGEGASFYFTLPERAGTD